LDSSQQNSTINDTGDQAPAVTSISGSGDAATAEAQTAAVAVEPSVTGIGEQAAANAGQLKGNSLAARSAWQLLLIVCVGSAREHDNLQSFKVCS
jgi:hypothetical protein